MSSAKLVQRKNLIQNKQDLALTSVLGFLSMSRMIFAFTTELPVTGGICNRFGVMAANSSPCKHKIQNERVTSVVVVAVPTYLCLFVAPRVLPTFFFSGLHHY